jgi:hypothetical protein
LRRRWRQGAGGMNPGAAIRCPAPGQPGVATLPRTRTYGPAAFPVRSQGTHAPVSLRSASALNREEPTLIVIDISPKATMGNAVTWHPHGGGARQGCIGGPGHPDREHAPLAPAPAR